MPFGWKQARKITFKRSKERNSEAGPSERQSERSPSSPSGRSDEADAQAVAQMEQEHMASLLAFAKLHGGVARPTNVAVEGLDARGLTLRVTDELSGVVTDQVLVPFPRPLESMDDVAELFVEMHRAAFAALPFSFKLRSRYYSEPATVALRKALKAACSSPTAVPVAAAAAIAVAAAGVLLLRTAGRMRR